MPRLLVLILLLWAGTRSARAQDDTLRVAPVPAQAFDDARALAYDPLGQLLVADAGRHVVERLSLTGRRLSRLGGPGTADGRFDEPADLDPTNGLVLLVADAGNGRVQRFSREHAFLGAFPATVPDAAGRGAQPVYGLRDPALDGAAPGRAVAVASMDTGEVFAVEAAQGVVLAWDRTGQFQRVIGGFEAGAGRLVRPVALAVDAAGLLYVADAGQDAVLVYDAFGSFVRRLADGRARGVRHVRVGGGRLWVVLPDRLLVYHLDGRPAGTLRPTLDAPLVDVAWADDTLYLLTATRLWRALR